MSAELSELPASLIVTAPRELTLWLEEQGLTLEDLRRPDNHPSMVQARVVVFRFLASRGWSSVMIGRFLDRHHTTVLHHLHKERRAS